eukprot:scaffold113052_cov40-Tisochrysis_lutea.AAC.1
MATLCENDIRLVRPSYYWPHIMVTAGYDNWRTVMERSTLVLRALRCKWPIFYYSPHISAQQPCMSDP